VEDKWIGDCCTAVSLQAEINNSPRRAQSGETHSISIFVNMINCRAIISGPVVVTCYKPSDIHSVTI
jgi:hypothetical protein